MKRDIIYEFIILSFTRSNMMKEYLSLVIIIGIVNCSHFRGGLISWRPLENRTVIITYRVSFRQFVNHVCESNYDGRILNGEGSLTCSSGCNETISYMSYYCVDYDEEENWSVGQQTINYTFPETNENVFQFGYSSNAWITLVSSGGGNWSLQVVANISQRQDTRKINSSPTTGMPSTIKLKRGCSYSLHIPVHDVDGDVIKCRWANTILRDECGSVCNALASSSLNENSCILTYNASGSSGMYAVALQIEDFASPGESVPLSSIPLQFVIKVYTSSDSCDTDPYPVFHNRTLANGVLVHSQYGEKYTQTIIARSGSSSSSIKQIYTVLPKGMVKSNLCRYGTFGNEWYVNVTWVPSFDQIGVHDLCYTAIGINGIPSDQYCILVNITINTGSYHEYVIRSTEVIAML